MFLSILLRPYRHWLIYSHKAHQDRSAPRASSTDRPRWGLTTTHSAYCAAPTKARTRRRLTMMAPAHGAITTDIVHDVSELRSYRNMRKVWKGYKLRDCTRRLWHIRLVRNYCLWCISHYGMTKNWGIIYYLLRTQQKVQNWLKTTQSPQSALTHPRNQVRKDFNVWPTTRASAA